jgi:hypothetical protein
MGLYSPIPDFGYLRPTNPLQKEYVSILAVMKLLRDGDPKCFTVAYGLSSLPEGLEVGVAGIILWDPTAGHVGRTITTIVKPEITEEQEASWTAAQRIGLKVLIGNKLEWQYSPLLMHLHIYKTE